MRFKLFVRCDNAAFGEHVGERNSEVARILRKVADAITGRDDTNVYTLRDTNGNTVGQAEWDGEA